MKRLYILTGKGGVGKTTISLALTKYLTINNPESRVCFISFNREVDLNIFSELDIEYLDISLKESTETYIAKKLKSQTVASLITKTPFFNALYNMIPSLGQMVTLGHIIDLLKKDPKLTIVMDSPASGHALSMFESTHNFKTIFGKGPLVQDIENMLSYLYDSNFLKTYILSLPTEMATQEARELKCYLEKIQFKESEIIVNECLSKNSILNEFFEELPPALKKKIEIEKEIFKGNESLNSISQYFENETKPLVSMLQNDMSELV